MSEQRIDHAAASVTQAEAAAQVDEKISGPTGGLGGVARTGQDFDPGDERPGDEYGDTDLADTGTKVEDSGPPEGDPHYGTRT